MIRKFAADNEVAPHPRPSRGREGFASWLGDLVAGPWQSQSAGALRPERDRRARGSRPRTYAVLLASWVAFASWASRIPQVRDRFHLDPSELGLALLQGRRFVLQLLAGRDHRTFRYPLDRPHDGTPGRCGDGRGLARLQQHAELSAGMTVPHSPTVSFEIVGDIPILPAAIEVAAYRSAQEAISNATKHAFAQRITSGWVAPTWPHRRNRRRRFGVAADTNPFGRRSGVHDRTSYRAGRLV